MTPSSRIMVTNFDSVNQAGMWLAQGAEQATDTLLAMLRTALLFGAQLVVDRNQVLDGVFFLSLGPDRIATQLGLERGAPLPIIMTVSPNAPDDKDAYSPVWVPRLRGDAEGERAVSLGRQLSDVRAEGYLVASSALAAITGASPGHPWMTPDPAPKWYPGCGFTDVLHPLPEGDEKAAMVVIRRAQDRWLHAARTARISVDAWSGAMDMAPALTAQRRRLREACSSDLEPAPLATRLLDEESTVRKDAVAVLDRWRVDHEATEDLELRMGLRLWTDAYYQAIARKDDCMLVTFNDAGLAPDQPADEQGERLELARSFGLAQAPRTWWQRMGERCRLVDRSGRSLRVDGEIVEHLRVIDPGTYRQLSRSARPVVASLVADDRSAMYDLALACRSAVALAPSHRRARLATRVRVVTLTLLAVLIAALTLVGDLGRRGSGLAVVLVVLGLLASLPWDDIRQHRELRRASMTATLDLRRAP